jgi:hypothetical protein
LQQSSVYSLKHRIKRETEAEKGRDDIEKGDGRFLNRVKYERTCRT